MINIIAAVSANGVIGYQGGIPWYFIADLKHFRKLTLNQIVVMGYKTLESIGSINLPRRENRVITRKPLLIQNEGIIFYSTPMEALEDPRGKDIWIIGGAEIYRELLPMVDRLYITEIFKSYPGDTYFPSWNRNEFREISRKKHSAFDFVIYERIK